jgi:hypothetical protein
MIKQMEDVINSSFVPQMTQIYNNFICSPNCTMGESI